MLQVRTAGVHEQEAVARPVPARLAPDLRTPGDGTGVVVEARDGALDDVVAATDEDPVVTCALSAWTDAACETVGWTASRHADVTTAAADATTAAGPRRTECASWR